MFVHPSLPFLSQGRPALYQDELGEEEAGAIRKGCRMMSGRTINFLM